MSHFLTDFTRNLIPSLWSIAMIQAFGVSSMIDGGAYGAACAIFFLFGWSIGPFCYLFSFLFNFEGNAMLVTFFVNVVLGTIIPMVMYILRIIPSTRSIAQVLMWIMRIFPSYSFGYGLLNVTSTKIIAKIEGVDSLEPSDIRASGGDMLMLGLMGIVYTILVFVCEYIFNIKKIGSAGLNVAAQAT
jgi:ATP-binding cassette subfamily A (ABC1) protein 3